MGDSRSASLPRRPRLPAASTRHLLPNLASRCPPSTRPHLLTYTALGPTQARVPLVAPQGLAGHIMQGLRLWPRAALFHHPPSWYLAQRAHWTYIKPLKV